MDAFNLYFAYFAFILSHSSSVNRFDCSSLSSAIKFTMPDKPIVILFLSNGDRVSFDVYFSCSSSPSKNIVFKIGTAFTLLLSSSSCKLFVGADKGYVTVDFFSELLVNFFHRNVANFFFSFVGRVDQCLLEGGEISGSFYILRYAASPSRLCK